MVCLSHHNQIVSTGYALSGSAYLTIPGLTIGDTLDVTVTAYNRIPYFGTVVVVANGTTQVGSVNVNNLGLTASPAGANHPSLISFHLPKATTVSMKIYSSTGQLVSRIFENQKFDSGNHRISQDVSGLSAGIYFVKMQTGENESIARMIVE